MHCTKFYTRNTKQYNLTIEMHCKYFYCRNLGCIFYNTNALKVFLYKCNVNVVVVVTAAVVVYCKNTP